MSTTDTTPTTTPPTTGPASSTDATPVPAPPPATPPVDEPTGDEHEEPGNREAARYRTRLRQAETERDTARDTLASYQRREVERLAAKRLSVGADVFAVGGRELSDLLDDDGQIDVQAVDDAVTEVLTGRPGLAHRQPWPDMGGGTRGDDLGTNKRATWHDLMHRQ